MIFKKKDLDGKNIFFIGLLKKFENQLKKSGKDFKEILEIDVKIKVKPFEISKIVFTTDKGVYIYEEKK